MAGSKRTILIVEDTKFYADMLEEEFSNDYIVYLALDGHTAINFAKNIVPDLILLDILMPELDGFEVCKLIKKDKNTKDIPIIFLTALSDESDEEKGFELGAIDYVKKPFNMNLLKARVQNQMRMKIKIRKLESEIGLSNKQIEKGIEIIIEGLSSLVELKDDHTCKHNHRTKHYMKILAGELCKKYPDELSKLKINLLCQASILHDIGKVGVCDYILLKKESLTEDEFDEIKQHTIFGREVIKKIEASYGKNLFLSIASEITEFHHEKWDGSGYPHRVKGCEIPLYARMMAIIDVYDALTSERPYKKAFSHEDALEIILNGDARVKPQHFDPQILEAFKKVQKKIKNSLIRHEYENPPIEVL